MMPRRGAIARAVAGWSPVIITGMMPAALQAAHRCGRFGPRRIDQADQPEKRQTALHRAGLHDLGQLAAAALREGEHAQALRGQCSARPAAPPRRGRRGAAGVELIGAQLQHAFRRALHEHQHAVAVAVQRASCARVRASNGMLGHARHASAAMRPCRSRPPAPRPAARSRSGRPVSSPSRPATASLHSAMARPSSRHGDSGRSGRPGRVCAGSEHAVHAHAVQRQRAGLVGADVGHRTERLDRRQPADQRVLPHHARARRARARSSPRPAAPRGWRRPPG